MPDVIWDRSGLYNSSHFGSSISSLGDQNDDGYTDWIVNAAGDWQNYPEDAYIEFFHGGDPPSTTPYLTITAGDSVFRTSYASQVGDLNGDGFVDWQVTLDPELGATGWRIYFYWGGPSNDLSPDLDDSLRGGSRYVGMGDFNGDGYDDLFLESSSGIGQVIFGGDPFDLEPDWIVHDDPLGSQLSLPIAFGDLNGDGFADILSVYDVGGQRAWFGSSEPDTIPQIISDLSTENWRDIIKDINGDGKDDFLVPAIGYIDVYFGGETLSPIPDYTLTMPLGRYGNPIVSIGDFNDDGYNDLVAVDDNFGMFALYLSYRWINPDPIFYVLDFGWQELYGIRTACGLGDVNGDGIADFAIGATNTWADARRGRAIVVAGSDEYIVGVAKIPPIIPETMKLSVYPNPFNSAITIELNNLPYQQKEIMIYDILGRQVWQWQGAASSFIWDGINNQGKQLSSGRYWIEVRSDGVTKTKPVILLK
ncbi:T9SS type A sorting domain-containing protein [bacterium]|nr:T9SS type A sorting domain-containing protein [bacterium]